VDRDRVERVLHEWQGLREVGGDPELEAVRLAILLEDVFGARLLNDEIDLTVLSDGDAVRDLLSRRGSIR
jgi:hypothetical protein